MDELVRKQRDALRKRLARRLAQQDGEGLVASDERLEDWAAFRREVWLDLCPRGSVDAAVCDLIAGALWRMQRTLRLEAACLSAFLRTERDNRRKRVAKAQLAFESGWGAASTESDLPDVVPDDTVTVSCFGNLQDKLARYALIEGRLANELRRLLSALGEARAQGAGDALVELDEEGGDPPPADAADQV